MSPPPSNQIHFESENSACSKPQTSKQHRTLILASSIFSSKPFFQHDTVISSLRQGKDYLKAPKTSQITSDEVARTKACLRKMCKLTVVFSVVLPNPTTDLHQKNGKWIEVYNPRYLMGLTLKIYDSMIIPYGTSPGPPQSEMLDFDTKSFVEDVEITRKNHLVPFEWHSILSRNRRFAMAKQKLTTVMFPTQPRCSMGWEYLPTFLLECSHFSPFTFPVGK